MSSYPETFGALKRSPWAAADRATRSVKDEMRRNLLDRLATGGPLFAGVLGYEETVMPQIVNALLSRHNFILLGLRGQAKSRILRALVTLLDPAMPIVAGSEVNDNAFAPISRYARNLLHDAGDDTPIAWVDRDSRFVEKLATPDVTIADMIGDLDPIKAARGGHILSDELTIHYGMLPRANRGIFALNELPDLAGKVQVGLFNVMQEGDVQIKGYPVRLALDVQLCFTANPEDYTARGKIITPLKDRIGSEIRTHYPASRQEAMLITKQEAWTGRDTGRIELSIPEYVREVVEEVAFQARQDQKVDKRSGVSQRLPISLLENVVSNAERRALTTGEAIAVPRITDIYAAIPAITGKFELEYEGELKGADTVAREMIRSAVAIVFDGWFPNADLRQVTEWFDLGGNLQVDDALSAEDLVAGTAQVQGLHAAAQTAAATRSGQAGDAKRPGEPQLASAIDFVLEGMYAQRKISRSVEGQFHAVEQPKRPARTMEPLTERDLPLTGNKKKYYN